MTDIKELRVAAERAKSAAEKYANGDINPAEFARQCSEFNSLTDSPAQILALLDELEGATSHVALLKIDRRELMRESDEKDARIAELESRAESAERALKTRSAPVGDLVMLIKVLVRALKKTGLNSELCESAMDYLRREQLICAADCLRDNDGIQIQGGE